MSANASMRCLPLGGPGYRMDGLAASRPCPHEIPAHPPQRLLPVPACTDENGLMMPRNAHSLADAADLQTTDTRRFSCPSFAALDLGTNNCRMLVAAPAGDGFRVLDSFSRIVRLGEGLHQTGRLSPIAMERALVGAARLRRPPRPPSRPAPARHRHRSLPPRRQRRRVPRPREGRDRPRHRHHFLPRGGRTGAGELRPAAG